MSTSEILIKAELNKKKIPFTSDPKRIISEVCKFFKVDKSLVLSKSRRRMYVYPRQVAQTLIHLSCLQNGTRITLEETGKHFSREDHSTILHSKKTIGDRAYIDPIDREYLSDLLSYLHSVDLCKGITIQDLIDCRS